MSGDLTRIKRIYEKNIVNSELISFAERITILRPWYGQSSRQGEADEGGRGVPEGQHQVRRGHHPAVVQGIHEGLP